MARLVHLNGPPGIGKSSLSARWADRHPGTLNLDVDVVPPLVGGWQDEENRTWQVVWPLVRAMAAAHLTGGRDVILPQYHGRLAEISALEELAGDHRAHFREVVLIDDRAAAIERFERRALQDADPWIRHHHRLVGRRGGPDLLGSMYDDLLEVVRRRPDAVLVRSVAGPVHDTYRLLTAAMIEPGQ